MGTLISFLHVLNTYSNLLLLIVAAISAVIAIGQWKDQRADNDLRIASGLTAWWATNHQRTGQLWGVVVSNTSNLTFYDVKIQSSGNFNKRAEPIHLNAVPPGYFFVEGLSESDQYNWRFAKEIKDFHNSKYEAILNSQKHEILGMTFSDYLNNKWEWSPENGIKRA